MSDEDSGIAQADYDARFSGIGRLYGADNLDRLRAAHIVVVGVGGVGSWTVEALARTGVGHLTLVDIDDICINNTNRQLPALDGNVGRLKVEVLRERVLRIQPSCKVAVVEDFYTAETSEAILSGPIDAVVDAIDDGRNKLHLIQACYAKKIPVIVCGGAGGRRDATKLEVDDLSRTQGDPLLRRVRQKLRKAGFPRDRRWRIKAVFSQERPVFPGADGGVCETRPERNTLRLDCASGFGSATFVTGTMGFIAAQLAVEAAIR